MTTEDESSTAAPCASASGVVLAVYSAALLIISMWLPWWRMECRAPQYGQRVLWIDVSPLTVTGDLKELDGLGHYVGMRPIESFAPLERSAATYGIVLVALLLLSLPFLPRRWLRTIPVLAAAAVPIGFATDLYAWQRYAVTHLDPHAALNMIANRVDARLVGTYSIAQFHVIASFQAGFWLILVVAAMALGFLIGEWRRRRPFVGRAPNSTGHTRLATVAATAVALLLAATPARAAIREVGQNAPYPTITSAIDAAAEGDEVLVHAGVYHEHLVIDRAITLRGEPRATVDGDGRGTILDVVKGPSVVRGLAFRHGGASLLSEDAGVKVKGVARCEIDGNEITDTLFGILIISSPDARVVANHVKGLDLPIARRGDGIRVHASDRSVIDDNVLDRTRDLAIWQSNHVSARRNVVRNARYGLHYMFCDDDLFEDNVFEDDQVGAAIMYSRRLTLRRNRFMRARGPSAYGLLIKVGDDVLVEDNWFIDNTRGILLDDTTSSSRSSCTFRRNVVAGNDIGVGLQPSVARIVFTENAFIGNRLEIEAIGAIRSDQNVWSLDGRGNYWSDYVGFDSDGDGIGDTPYRPERFVEKLSERWPAVGLLRFGPAAEALELAARAFPIVAPTAILSDEHPMLRPPVSLGAAPHGASRPWLMLAGLGALSLSLSAARWARREEGGSV